MRLIPMILLVSILIAAPLRAEESPDWTFETIDGSDLTLSEAVSEQTTILFFWATWCPYCKALMPHLQSIELEYGDDVEIVAILIVDEDMEIRFDLRELPARSLPTDVESSGHGRRAAHRAPWWAAEIRAALDAVLAD